MAGYAQTYTDLDGLAEALIEVLKEKGLIGSKPSQNGGKKKKITNLWFDEDTGEIVIEHE